MVPPQVMQWVKRNYPRPQVDPEWLDGCWSWIESELKLHPAKDMEAILYNVDSQLLQSDLSDSMLEGTGLPPNISELDDVALHGPPVLVEIVAITEIGHSAFSLQSTRQARLERADLAGLAEEEENEDEDGAVPNYPRSMLKFHLSDGSTVLEAIEYRRIPEIQLGVTPLGYKLQLKDVLIRRGIAFLEPSKITLKGFQTEDRQSMQDADFVRGLKERLGVADTADGNDDGHQAAPPQNLPPPPSPAHNQPPVSTGPPPRPTPPSRQPPRSPLQELHKPPEPSVAGPSGTLHEDDEDLPRRRKVPVSKCPQTLQSSETPAGPSLGVSSRYFTADPGVGKGKRREVPLSRELRLSPHRHGPVIVPDSEDEDEIHSPLHRPPVFRGKDAPPLVVHPDPDTGISAGNQSPHSSDYDFDFDVTNEDFLTQVDKAEREALSGTAGTSQSTLVASTSAHASKRETSVASTNSLGGGGSVPPRAGSSTQRRRRAERPQPLINLGSITIDDDEPDEKENVPVPTRHVRRRMSPWQPDPEAIIEISD
ncbi:hypothetical protein BDY19DRAFT_696571 [Irpex rosettiformis]|uniref:Uncharacterized protein n=1 Tax=Irpex rosettiformis TaxID=378272 RepID=A0ACB8UAL8_9APHY|nr:hypothetical protein BDY19DRAFT_696571 [Irpex rosettiformis]